MLHGYHQRSKDSHMDAVAQAWSTANFTRAKRLPSLASLMADHRRGERTEADLEAARVDHERILALAATADQGEIDDAAL